MRALALKNATITAGGLTGKFRDITQQAVSCQQTAASANTKDVTNARVVPARGPMHQRPHEAVN